MVIMMSDLMIFSLIGLCLVIWLVRAYKRNRLEVRVFTPDESKGGSSNTAPARTFTLNYSVDQMRESPTLKVQVPAYDQFEEGKSYTTRGGKSVETDAVFDAWTSGELNAMVAVLGLRTHPVDRHHLLNCLVEAAYKRRDDPAMADLCASTAETYLAEFPVLLRAIRKESSDRFTPHIPVFQQYATLLTERKQFDRAVEICELAMRRKLQDNTQSGFEGRIERIKKLRAKAEGTTVVPAKPKRKSETVTPLIQLPEVQLQPTIASAPAQAWQTTVNNGAADIDRLIAQGDWDSARAALQHIAYGMVDAEPEAKRQFSQAMCRFAARDPLYHAVMKVAAPLVEQSPGMLQTKLYPHLPNLEPETIRYVIYYAAEMGDLVRRKKGNSYAVFPKSYTLNSG
jgi:hypothetical protein